MYKYFVRVDSSISPCSPVLRSGRRMAKDPSFGLYYVLSQLSQELAATKLYTDAQVKEIVEYALLFNQRYSDTPAIPPPPLSLIQGLKLLQSTPQAEKRRFYSCLEELFTFIERSAIMKESVDTTLSVYRYRDLFVSRREMAAVNDGGAAAEVGCGEQAGGQLTGDGDRVMGEPGHGQEEGQPAVREDDRPQVDQQADGQEQEPMDDEPPVPKQKAFLDSNEVDRFPSFWEPTPPSRYARLPSFTDGQRLSWYLDTPRGKARKRLASPLPGPSWLTPAPPLRKTSSLSAILVPIEEVFPRLAKKNKAVNICVDLTRQESGVEKLPSPSINTDQIHEGLRDCNDGMFNPSFNQLSSNTPDTLALATDRQEAKKTEEDPLVQDFNREDSFDKTMAEME